MKTTHKKSGFLRFLLVGVRGFEPPTPTSRTWCANRAALHPETLLFCDLKYRIMGSLSNGEGPS